MTGHDAAVEHELLGPYLLGALDEHQRNSFEAHLADCPRCLAEGEELGPLVWALPALTDEEVTALDPQSGTGGRPTGPDVVAVARAQPSAGSSARRPRRRRWLSTGPRRAGLVAAAVVAGLLLVPAV